MLTAFLAGFGLCFSIIAVPGAQNVFLLREGIRRAGESRRQAILLAAVCLASDVVLISAGVAGFGAAVEAAPWLFDAARWAGVVFLAGYGLFAAFRAIRGGGEGIETSEPGNRGGAAPAPGRLLPPDEAGASDGAHPAPTTGTATLVRPRAQETVRLAILPAMLTCVAITWLNPHTYLDTVLLLGSISTSYGAAHWGFAVGAMLGSAAWFTFLTFAARFAARWLRSPRSWRVLDGVVAVFMTGMAAALAL